MAGRQIYDENGFKNIEIDGVVKGYQFQWKAQYYRGITLSIIRAIEVDVDGVKAAKEDIRLTVNGETFTLDEMRTVVDADYRWEFGDYATVTVMKEGGLAKGMHHIIAKQVIAPSYMPFQIEALCETNFEIN